MARRRLLALTGEGGDGERGGGAAHRGTTRSPESPRVAVLVPRATRGEQVVRAHQAQHALAAHADHLRPQPRVHLPMPLAVERTGREDGANLHDQGVVGKRGLWPTLPAVRRRDDHRGRVRGDPEGIRDADQYLLHAPLAPGAHWTAVQNLVVQHFTVAAIDATVKTRAGAFSKCVVVRNESPVASLRCCYFSSS